MSWAAEVDSLNTAVLTVFGDSTPVTIEQKGATPFTVTVVWLESDAGDRTLRAQGKKSDFAVLPVEGGRLIRGGKSYSIRNPQLRDGDWITMDLRLIPGNA